MDNLGDNKMLLHNLRMEITGLEGNIKDLIVDKMIELKGDKINNFAYYLESSNSYIIYDTKARSFALLSYNRIETEGRSLDSMLDYIEDSWEYASYKDKTSNIKERIRIIL